MSVSRAALARRHRRTSRETDHPAWRIYLWAFIVRALAGSTAYWLTQVTDIPFFEDAVGYESMGYTVAWNWLEGRSANLDMLPANAQMVWVMVMAIAGCYYVMGGVRAVPILLVLWSAITALVPVYTYFIGRELGMAERPARRAAWLVALSPTFVFFAGSLHKEGLILLALSLAVLHALRLQAGWQGRSFTILVLAVGALFGLRFYIGVLMTFVVAAGLFLVRKAEVPSSVGVSTVARQALTAAVFLGLVVTLGLTQSAERRLTETQEGVLVEVHKARYWSAVTAHSGYFPEADISTPGEAAGFLPVGLLYFLTVPLPWQTGNLRQNMIIPETAFWLLLYPFIVIGLVRGFRANRPGMMLCAAATVGMCIIYALISGNVGIAYRMRSQVWLLWAPFAAWGWEVWRERRSETRERRARIRPGKLVGVKLG